MWVLSGVVVWVRQAGWAAWVGSVLHCGGCSSRLLHVMQGGMRQSPTESSRRPQAGSLRVPPSDRVRSSPREPPETSCRRAAARQESSESAEEGDSSTTHRAVG